VTAVEPELAPVFELEVDVLLDPELVVEPPVEVPVFELVTWAACLAEAVVDELPIEPSPAMTAKTRANVANPVAAMRRRIRRIRRRRASRSCRARSFLGVGVMRPS
jgi:hypothetical protein